MIGELKILTLKDVFKDEPSHFTPWLKGHIHLLKRDIGFNAITITDTECKSENFRVDMIGYVNNTEEQRVIIENQFGDSNHDHLGKLITYSAEYNVNWAIWIVENARIEHIKAVEHLNKAFSIIGFLLIEAKVYKIDDSKPAIKFTPVVKPKDLNKISANENKLSAFWRKFLTQENKNKCKLISNRRSNSGNFIDLPGGTGYNYKITVAKNDVKICIVLNGNSAEENEYKRQYLETFKDYIEKQLGTLDWDYGWKNTHSKTIALILTNGGYDDENKYEMIIANVIDFANKFEQIFNNQLINIDKL